MKKISKNKQKAKEKNVSNYAFLFANVTEFYVVGWRKNEKRIEQRGNT